MDDSHVCDYCHQPYSSQTCPNCYILEEDMPVPPPPQRRQTRNEMTKQGQYVSKELFYGGSVPELKYKPQDYMNTMFTDLDLSLRFPTHRSLLSNEETKTYPPVYNNSVLLGNTVMTRDSIITQSLPWYNRSQGTSYICAYIVFIIFVIVIVMGVTSCKSLDGNAAGVVNEEGCLIMNLIFIPILVFWSCAFGINSLGFPCIPYFCTFDRSLNDYLRYMAQDTQDMYGFLDKSQLQASQKIRTALSNYKSARSGLDIKAGLWVKLEYLSENDQKLHRVAYPLLALEEATGEGISRNWENDSPNLPHVRCTRVEMDSKNISSKIREIIPKDLCSVEYTAEWNIHQKAVDEALVMVIKIRDFLGPRAKSVTLENIPYQYTTVSTFSKDHIVILDRTCGSIRYWCMLISAYTGFFWLFYCLFRRDCPIIRLNEFVLVEVIDSNHFDNLVKTIDKRLRSNTPSVNNVDV